MWQSNFQKGQVTGIKCAVRAVLQSTAILSSFCAGCTGIQTSVGVRVTHGSFYTRIVQYSAAERARTPGVVGLQWKPTSSGNIDI